MRAEQQLFDAATASADLTTLIGSGVYPELSPEGLRPPLIVYERRGSEPISTIHDDLRVAAKVSITASCWARTRIDAEQLGDLLEVALRNVGSSVNRFAHADEEKQSYAAVIDFEIWEIGL